MSNEQPSRPRRSGSSASPMGSTLAIVIAIAAVVVGFLILKNIRDNNNDNNSAATTAPTSTINPSSTTQPVFTNPPVTQPAGPVRDGATVLVANSSHQNKVAGQLTTALKGIGYTTIDPANGSTKEALTRIQYKDGDSQAQAVANSLATDMGVAAAQVEIMPVPPQLSDPATLGVATVLVLLGDDKAGRTLDQMTGVAPETTSPSGGATSSSAAP